MSDVINDVKDVKVKKERRSRKNVVYLRLSDVERDMLYRLAGDEGLNVSEFLRFVIRDLFRAKYGG